jgi:hypothetical protein
MIFILFRTLLKRKIMSSLSFSRIFAFNVDKVSNDWELYGLLMMYTILSSYGIHISLSYTLKLHMSVSDMLYMSVLSFLIFLFFWTACFCSNLLHDLEGLSYKQSEILSCLILRTHSCKAPNTTNSVFNIHYTHVHNPLCTLILGSRLVIHQQKDWNIPTLLYPVLNLYHPNLFLHVQEQVPQLPSTTTSESVLHWGTCSLLYKWPIWDGWGL